MARGIDSYGFQDIELSIQFLVALNSNYRYNDGRKFKLNTLAEVWRSMTRCWMMEPISERVIADIEDWPRARGIIIVRQRLFRSRGGRSEWSSLPTIGWRWTHEISHEKP
jgi:hypothetical protein